MEETAEIWIQNWFEFDRMNFTAPPLNPAIKADILDELGQGTRF